MIDEETKKLIYDTIDGLLSKYMTVDRTIVPGGNPDAQKSGKFKSFGEFLCAVKLNPNDVRLKGSLTEGTDSAGGYSNMLSLNLAVC